MTDIERQIEALTLQLQELRNRQLQMNTDMVIAERKLQALKATFAHGTAEKGTIAGEAMPAPIAVPPSEAAIAHIRAENQEKKVAREKKRLRVNNELEDFIGTNVISKIGILVTIIGVFIGVKYAIDKELISPALRIMAGYLSAGVLMFFAVRLKHKYSYFSSNLMGGALAVTYFITYSAYSFYSLFPAALAFGLMVATTLAAVVIALWYNEKIIALIGQVAAYAIPFLLSSGQGNVFILLGYITIINCGLLVLSFKKQWKILYHSAFFLTWLIYSVTMVAADTMQGSFSTALLFLTINFFTFYATFLSYKILKKELYQVGEIGILLLNALFFFFLGGYLIGDEFRNIHFLTWFTIANAVIHLGAGFLMYRLRLTDQSVFQFVLGLGLLFITLAVPIELDGNWVTALWIIEATVLCYVARNTSGKLYLQIALPLIVLSFISLLHDWEHAYPSVRIPAATAGSMRTPFANINFTLSLIFCTCLAFIVSSAYATVTTAAFLIRMFYTRWLPVAFIAILYLTCYNEIDFAWAKRMMQDFRQPGISLQSITLLIFSCLYFAAWLIVNNRHIKNTDLQHLLIVLAFFTNAAFLFDGLTTVGDLRHFYMTNAASTPVTLLSTRYLLVAAVALLWLQAWTSLRIFKPSDKMKRGFSMLFNVTLLSVISNEFIHWLDIAGYQDQDKLGLSIICGTYALALLFAGILRKKKHLRISAIVLFTATLLKLFFYDLSTLSTISKTIVLVLLGILLLLASFLYNKYKDLLFIKEDAAP